MANFTTAERDKLEETRRQLERRLEGCEAELKDKEEELFLQLERSLRLEDEVERARQEREVCLEARERLEREQTSALRQLQIQSAQNEITRRSLERARQEVVRQATAIRAERDALERENEALKEKLRVEQDELGEERRRNEEGVAALTHEATTLRHAARHLRAAALHATSCRRRRRCSVCLYARRTFQDVDDYRDDGKLFKCLQAPLQDLRTWLRPGTPAALPPLRTSSPLEGGTISYIDDSGTSSEDEAYSNTPAAEVSLSSTVSSAPATARAFSSDSGFSSETGDRRSRSYECGNSSRKISESSSSEPGDAASAQRLGTFTRSRWTSSFRKLLGRKSKAKGSPHAQHTS
ncbi:PREDICTED: coiled-coil domain-containing protein 57-like [Ceratosolen solmsi marchali]|uniref:Coiled-coil domain-containing protein 57-like n=1 Tax=Ceratosolen solmsi marchali TaxID=326594 RepID=A0AAJ6YCM0_9HYME|nr:PREDICTED: coiled-coil domain-containing protein 57-like [Ceratosolen solmsi marchali]